MSRQLTFSVVADGGTDRVLVPIIEWAIHRLDPQVEILEPGFSKRHCGVKDFLKDYRSDAVMVFVHRDAERLSLDERMREFEPQVRSDVVPVVPVRMSEAWIPFDGTAIARAAGSSGREVSVPDISDLETIADSKELLDRLLLTAAGSPSGRRCRNFRRSIIKRRVSVASYTSDYGPLQALPAFRHFQKHLELRYPYPNVTRP